MIKQKSSFGRFPLKIKVSFRKSNIYLFPQGWGCWDSLSNISYQTKGIYKHKNYLIPTWYCFSWLWLNINFTLKQDFQSESLNYHEPVKVVHGKEIF